MSKGPIGLLLALVTAAFLAGFLLAQMLHTDTSPTAVDVGFLQSMALHHDQAITLSRVMLTEKSELTAVARAIETDQLLELGQMRGWLQLWDVSILPKTNEAMGWINTIDIIEPELLAYASMCRASPDRMPGLATQTELQALRSAQGIERERQFLQLMIRHHDAGLPMAKIAARYAKVAAVRSLAQRIVYAQSNEVIRLQQELTRRNKQIIQVPSP